MTDLIEQLAEKLYKQEYKRSFAIAVEENPEQADAIAVEAGEIAYCEVYAVAEYAVARELNK